MNNSLSKKELEELEKWKEAINEAHEIGWSTYDLHQIAIGFKLIKESFSKIGVEIKMSDLFNPKNFK